MIRIVHSTTSPQSCLLPVHFKQQKANTIIMISPPGMPKPKPKPSIFLWELPFTESYEYWRRPRDTILPLF